MTVDRSVLFGVPIDGYTIGQTLDVIDECIRNGRAQGRSYQVTTVNVDFLVNALSDPKVMALLQRADVNLADGMPLVWASRVLGTPVPERVAGADLVPLLGAESAARGWRVHLFGAGPGVARRAQEKLLKAHPNALITADSGPESVDVREPDELVIESIRSVDADVLCVALGNPKQEQFIATYRDRLRCPVMIGIGGSLDMLTGEKQRAPSWAQRAGVEWIFRAAQEPGRLGRRYAHDFSVFGPEIFKYARVLRRYRTAQHLTELVSTPGRLTMLRANDHDETPDRPPTLRDITTVEIDLQNVDALAPPAHARLLALVRDARIAGIPIIVRHVSASMRACFRNYGTWNVLAEILTVS